MPPPIDYKSEYEKYKKKNEESSLLIKKYESELANRQPTTTFDLANTLSSFTPKSIGSVIESNIKPSEIEKGFLESFNKMENAAMGLAQKFGGSRDMVTQIKKTIDLATPSVMALGGSIEDVVNIQEGVINALQKQVILDKDSYADMFAIGNLINDGNKTSVATTKELVSNFKNLGYSIYDITGQMGDVINMARDMGVATSAVYSQLNENIGKLNLYNFDNGIKGMAKMAAEAASLRLNMSDTLQFAEKVFKPEDAFEMAANMQRLGVSVSNLLDPFKMMDMAQNRPEELQKSLMEAAREFVRFDEKQGRFIVSDTRRLREYADMIGKSAEEVAKMGINFADMDRKMRTIDFGKDITSEEDKKFFAGLAELKDGKYVVNVATDGQEPVLREISQLKEDEIKRLKRDEKEREKSPAQLQLESLHSLKRMELLLGSMAGLVPRHLAASATAERLGMEVEKKASPVIKSTMGLFGIKEEKGRVDIKETAYRLDNVGDKITSHLEKIFTDPETGITGAFTDLTNVVLETITGFGKIDEIINKVAANATEISKRESEGRGETDFTDYNQLLNNIKTTFSGLVSQGVIGTTQTPTTNQQTTTSTSNMNPTTNTLPTVTTTQTPNTNNTGTVQSNVTTTPAGALSVLIDGYSPNAATIITQSQVIGLLTALDKYSNSPALSVSLWGDNIGLTSGVKEVKEGIDKNAKQQKIDSDNKKIQTPTVPTSSNNTTTPSSTDKTTTPTVITQQQGDNSTVTSTNINYGNVLNSMSSGKLSEETLKILKQNSETKEEINKIDTKLVQEKVDKITLKDVLNVSAKKTEEPSNYVMKMPDKAENKEMTSNLVMLNKPEARENYIVNPIEKSKETLEKEKNIDKTLFSFRETKDSTLSNMIMKNEIPVYQKLTTEPKTSVLNNLKTNNLMNSSMTAINNTTTPINTSPIYSARVNTPTTPNLDILKTTAGTTKGEHKHEFGDLSISLKLETPDIQDGMAKQAYEALSTNLAFGDMLKNKFTEQFKDMTSSEKGSSKYSYLQS